jgi:hypothetical protein
MDRALIAPEDARRTVAFCEETGAKLVDNDTGELVGHLRHGALTYWVRYTLEDGTAALADIYCHRAALCEVCQ